MANLTDDVARLARECWRLNLAMGFQSRVGWEPGTLGLLAKATGATEATVSAWLTGSVQPSTAQAIALMDALPLPQVGAPVAAMNGSH